MSEIMTPDKLMAGSAVKTVTEDVTVQSGLNLKRGSCLGKVTAAVGSPVAGGANTGDGTVENESAQRSTQKGDYILTAETAGANARFGVADPLSRSLPDAYTGDYSGTGDGVLSELKGGRLLKRNGVYEVKCTIAGTNSATFQVTDPDGTVLGTLAFSGAGANDVFVNDQISFKITDGSADFIVGDIFHVAPYLNDQISFDIVDGSTNFDVGDTFTIPCTVGARDCKLVDSSLSDGAQNPYAILSEDVDASSVALKSIGYTTGEFNEDALIFGGVDTKETHRVALRDLNIHLKETSPDPTSLT